MEDCFHFDDIDDMIFDDIGLLIFVDHWRVRALMCDQGQSAAAK